MALNIFRNPLVTKGIRARLRLKALIGAGVVTLVISTFIFLVSYLTATERGILESQLAGRAALVPIFVVQCIILMFMGTGSVASGIVMERERGLLDYQRMTPMSPTSKIFGYLFGLAAREYYMFLLTMPFVILSIVLGRISLFKILNLYVVFFSSVWLYHMTGFVAGMLSKKPTQASWLARVIVIVLYLFLPRLADLGFTFFGFLTVLPTFYGMVKGEVSSLQNPLDQAHVAQWEQVPFFTVNLNPTVFTIIIQGFLLVTFFFVIYRKWHQEGHHAFSKVFSIVFFLILQLLLLGSLWPALAGAKSVASPLLNLQAKRHEGSHAPFRPEVTRGVELQLLFYIFFLISGVANMLLVHVITPSRHKFTRGLRRARKLGMTRIPVTSDSASSLWYVAGCVALTLVNYFVFVQLARVSGVYFESEPSLWSVIALPLLFAGMVLYMQAIREYWSGRAFFFSLFVLWIIPFLISTILLAAFDMRIIASYASASTPMTAFLFGVQNLLMGQPEGLQLPGFEQHTSSLVAASIVLNALLAGVFLTLRTRQRQALIHSELKQDGVR